VKDERHENKQHHNLHLSSRCESFNTSLPATDLRENSDSHGTISASLATLV
jgi:hypothetical protein